MPFDSQGKFTRIHSWEQDRINDVDIVSDRHDEEDDNFAEGLSACVCKDGRSVMSGNLNLGGYRINNVADGLAANDVVNKKQLDDLSGTLTEELTAVITNIIKAQTFVGDVKTSVKSENHGGWILCNGQELSRTVYADLFDVIGTRFGAGDGSTTFNVPDYRGKFLRGLGGNSAADIYTTQAEGLPNITGNYNHRCLLNHEYGTGAGTQEGAFYTANGGWEQQAGGIDGGGTTSLAFDASRSNSIYGASTHVTPLNQAINYFILAKLTQ
ncbi:MAG: tail fiber protein [Alphaproteobacteria bacterium]|nr:tail fiber protein [Alphaproteobacteria bacterium]